MARPDGRQRKKAFGRQSEARRFAATVEADIVRGQYVDLSHRLNVAEYARRWAASRPHRPTTARRTAGLINNHIAGTRPGGRRLTDVKPSEVQGWASDRATLLGPATTRSLVGLLRSIYAAAVLDRLVAVSPVVRVTLPRVDRPRVIPLTVEQVAALAATVPDRYRAMVITQAGLGLRIGELLALRVEDADFLRRTVRVEWQFTSVSKVRSEPKTPRSRRSIAPGCARDRRSAPGAIPSGRGRLLVHHDRRRTLGHIYRGHDVFRKAVAAAGLPVGTTSHDLRHHFASVLLAAGESVVAVAERLGHEDASLVVSTYGHLMPDSEDRARRAVAAAWESAGFACAPNVPQAVQALASR